MPALPNFFDMHVTLRVQDLPRAPASAVLYILTFSYSGAYKYHTLNPIESIRDHQQYGKGTLEYDLINALAHFRHVKSEELSFVSKAVSPDRLFFQVVDITAQETVSHHLYRLPYLQEQ